MSLHITPQLLANVDPRQISFTEPKKVGPVYAMKPVEPVLVQTPPVVCIALEGRKLVVELDPMTHKWIQDFEAHFKAYTQANVMTLFHKEEIDDDFVEESFKSCLTTPMNLTLTEGAPVFLPTHEMLSRDAVLPGTRLNLLLEVNSVLFGRKWFSPKLRVTSLRIAPQPPPSPAPLTYESLGWHDDGFGFENGGDDETVSIDIDLDDQQQQPRPQQEQQEQQELEGVIDKIEEAFQGA